MGEISQEDSLEKREHQGLLMLWSEEDERWEETEVRGVGRARRDDVWEPNKNVSKRRD